MTDNSSFDAEEELRARGLPIPEPVDIFADREEASGAQLEPVKQESPDGRSAHEKGVKLDKGKPSMFMGFMNYFFRAACAVAEISKLGARKYTWGGWRTVENGYERYTDAMLRHMAEEAQGNLYDPETGMLHAAHAAWGANARLELLLDEHPLVDPNFEG